MPLVKRGQSSCLAVIVHGWSGNAERMQHIRRSVEEKLPDADIFLPEYHAGIFSNTDPLRVARALEDELRHLANTRSQRADGRRYEQIILIGFSIGALIVRQMYLFGRGVGERATSHDIRAALDPADWVKIPVRLVLLAGMNRGWELEPRPEHMTTAVYLKFRLGMLLSAATRTGKLIGSARRGAPFVADQRVRWARLQARGDSFPLEVYQLLGEIDDLVSQEDQTDLFMTPDFIFIPVVETNHRQILLHDDSPFGRRRKEVFEEVLTLPKEELLERYGDEHERIKARESRPSEKHAVFVLHGIRDSGRWVHLLADSFRRSFPGLAVRTAKYAYFPMGAFLVLGSRQRNVRWFMDQYTEEVARCPDGQISFVGHSNGTYILARALDRYRSVDVHRVVFAGSVVPRRYPWGQRVQEGRVSAIQNYIADRDWVVAIFPRLFELIGEITPFKRIGDIGSAGFHGFMDPIANERQYVVRGEHSGALVPENHDPIMRFIATGDVIPPAAGIAVKDVDPRVDLLSRLCWVVWSFLAVLAIGGGYLLTTTVAAATGTSIAPWAIAYVLLLWLFLQTV